MDQYRLLLGHTIICHQDLIEPKFLKRTPGLHEIIIGSVDQSGPENRGIWEDIQDLLFSNIFSREILGNRVGMGTRTGEMNQAI